MNITKITEQKDTRINVNRRAVTTQDLQREFDYYRSVILLQKMLQTGLISKDECDKIDRLNRQSFSPFGVELLL